MIQKLIFARRRESQTWVFWAMAPWEKVSRLRLGKSPLSRNAYMKVHEQRNPYEWECPESKSCFFDAHKVIEAKTQEEAENLCRT